MFRSPILSRVQTDARSDARFGLLTGVTLALAVGLASGCRAPGERDLERTPHRAAVATTEVTAALIESPDVSAAAIRVSLDGERIVLDGFVDDGLEREAAGRIAGNAGAGRPVDNRLVVR